MFHYCCLKGLQELLLIWTYNNCILNQFTQVHCIDMRFMLPQVGDKSTEASAKNSDT